MIDFVYNDGGRQATGYKGKAGDCVTRAIAIASGKPYKEVYEAVREEARKERKGKRKRGKSNPREGVYKRTTRRLAERFGGRWVPTMEVGSGCQVHLRSDELPEGRLAVQVSKHLAAVIDGVLHDISDCSRGGTRCVYGYYIFDTGVAVGFLDNLSYNKDYPNDAKDIIDYEVTKLCQNKEFVRKVRKAVESCVSRTRRRIGTIGLPEDEILLYIDSAIKMGYFRYVYMTFAASKDLDKEWWSEQRKTRGRKAKDRRLDGVIVVQEFGDELNDYFPDPPPTDEDIIENAALEFRDMVESPGTDYHVANESVRYFRRIMDGKQPDDSLRFTMVKSNREHLEREKFSVTTITGMLSTDTVVPIVDTVEKTDDGLVLSKEAIQIAALAMELFGTSNGLYWFFGRLFFQGKIPELIRQLGGTEEELGPETFERIRKDLSRKLPKMDLIMAEKIKEEKELLPLLEHFDVS